MQRLTRENNELHIQVIKVKEENTEVRSELLIKTKELESAKNDARFFKDEAAKRISELESEVRQLRNKLELAGVKGGKVSENTNSSNQFADFQVQQEIWADELKRADERCVSLKADLTTLSSEKRDLVRQIGVAADKLKMRDSEI